MERIFAKAQREKAVEDLQTLLDSVKGLPVGSPEREAAYTGALERLAVKMEKPDVQRETWDFSREKAQLVFVQDDAVVIRPVNDSDAEFYVSVRMQYSMMYRVMIGVEKHRSESLFKLDICQPESFYCVIEDSKRVPIGYLGIKDTSAEIWELAIELDKQYTQHGLGPRSIALFLNEVSRITGKTKYKATIEADNVPSQKCFEKIGAVLMGLCDGPLLKTPEEKCRFEENNLNLIDDTIRGIADRLAIEPCKLLSHVLDYRIECPIKSLNGKGQ